MATAAREAAVAISIQPMHDRVGSDPPRARRLKWGRSLSPSVYRTIESLTLAMRIFQKPAPPRRGGYPSARLRRRRFPAVLELPAGPPTRLGLRPPRELRVHL